MKTQEVNQGIEGIFYRYEMDERQGELSCEVFRFYVDGLVLAARIRADDLTVYWPHIAGWFCRGFEDNGKYLMAGNALAFSTTSPYGTIEYNGRYLGDKIVLNTYSYINGFQAENEVYSRFTIPEA